MTAGPGLSNPRRDGNAPRPDPSPPVSPWEHTARLLATELLRLTAGLVLSKREKKARHMAQEVMGRHPTAPQAVPVPDLVENAAPPDPPSS